MRVGAGIARIAGPVRKRKPSDPAHGMRLALRAGLETLMAITHILVPTDFSEASERAIASALDLAHTFEARVTLLHVWSLPVAGYAETLSWPVEEMQQAAKMALDEALAKTAKRHAKTDAVLRQGLEWQAILDVIDDRKCDLVVMATHGRKGLSRFLLGSVAEKVVRLSPVPVLTVRAAASET